MNFLEVLKERFEAETGNNFVACIMKIKGREFVQFFRISDIVSDEKEAWFEALEKLELSGKKTVDKVLR